MTPRTPLLLVDNLFDAVTLYPGASVAADDERPGHEAFRVADYRRERTSWQPSTAAANRYVAMDLGPGASHGVDYIFLDRGHNLWGKTVFIESLNAGGTTWTTRLSLTVPALGTLGGDPTTGFAVTEEGACYALFTPLAAQRGWRLNIGPSMIPVVTGLMLGLRTQLLGFSSVFDEDAGERTQTTAVSTAGYQGSDRTYAWRTLLLDLKLIGATEYDTTIRRLRDQLFAKNQPVWIAMDYGTYPERGWLYQLDGKSWSFAKSRVLRNGQVRMREVGSLV